MPDPTRPTLVRERGRRGPRRVRRARDRGPRGSTATPRFLGEGGFDGVRRARRRAGCVGRGRRRGLVGNVMLRPRSAPPSVELAADALGVAPDRLGFVARLMVAPRARRRGVARQLLDVAVGGARRLGRVPVLDVVTSDAAAVALYERRPAGVGSATPASRCATARTSSSSSSRRPERAGRLSGRARGRRARCAWCTGGSRAAWTGRRTRRAGPSAR